MKFQGLAELPTYNPSYRQSFSQVLIDSTRENTEVQVKQPRQTLAGENQAMMIKKNESSLSGTLSGAFSILMPWVTPTISGSISTKNATASEHIQYLSRITEKNHDGVVKWGFTVDDDYDQVNCAELTEGTLPIVNFVFWDRGEDQVPPFVCVELSTLWTAPFGAKLWGMIADSKDSNLLLSYRNLYQIVKLEAPTNLQESRQYKATINLGPGKPYHLDVKHNDSLQVYPAVIPSSVDLKDMPTFRHRTSTHDACPGPRSPQPVSESSPFFGQVSSSQSSARSSQPVSLGEKSETSGSDPGMTGTSSSSESDSDAPGLQANCASKAIEQSCREAPVLMSTVRLANGR